MTSTRLQEEFVTLLQAHVPDLERNGSKATGSVPWREDAHPSLSADLDKAVWYDRARKQGGGVKEFKAQLGLNGTAPEKQIVDTYDYVDENNILLYQVIRYDDKTFSQRKPDGKEGWIWNLRGVRRVPYRLSDILDKPTIYIVEGEKDADRLWSLGFPATTNPHGAGQWRAEYNPHFTGKHVVLFPDYDEPGEAHGLDVASNLEPVAESVKIVRLPGLPLKGDVSDWLDQGHTKEELEAIVDATPALKPEDLKAKPSNGHTEATWPELDNAALHGLAGEIVSTIDPYTEADPVATLLNVLTAFGNCVNAAPHARVQHDKHPARLFVVLVGDTSKGRKGTGWSTPRYLFSRCDPDWTRERIKSGLSSGEGLIYNVRDPVYKQEPVKEKGRVIDYQTVCVDQGESDKRLLIIKPEFASTLTVMGRDGNILSAVMRQAWDDGNLSPLTKNNPIKATHAHVSLIGHITIYELLARLDDTSKANGFANRFVWALVRRSKELPEGAAVPEEVCLRLAERLSEVITFSRSVSEIKRNEEARVLWHAVYHDLSEGKPGLLGAVLSRAEAQVLRLSIIYALLDMSDVVRVEHLRAALAVWEYAERSAVLIFGQRLGDPTADRILEALRNAGQNGMSDNDIYELFGKHKSANERARALNMLATLGLITSTQEETGGRPRTVYSLA